MTIFFIRHGETTGDVEDRFGGTYNDHLSEGGTAQSNDLGRQLANKGIHRIISSTLFRAQETAHLLRNYVNGDCTLGFNPERSRIPFLF